LRVPHPPSLYGTKRLFAGAVNIAGSSTTVVLQPIVTVADGELVAAEALARFAGSNCSPDATIAAAHAAGRGGTLEATLLTNALAARSRVPFGVLLSVNVSPAALLHPAVRAVLDTDLTGVIVEITEQPILDSESSDRVFTELRNNGAKLAVDDAAAGYAGLKRVAAIRPDFVKLDRSLITGSRHSLDQISVIEAIVSLSHRLGSLVIGEGVESFDDLATLAELDVDYAQGRAIAMPLTDLPEVSPDVVTACRTLRAQLLGAESPLALAPRNVALHRLSSTLAGSAEPSDLDAALSAASASLDVDRIGLSVLVEAGDFADGAGADLGDGVVGGLALREFKASTTTVDENVYPLRDYRATRAAIESGSLIEAHLDDPTSDAAERQALAAGGYASLLLVPLYAQGRPIGVMEFQQHAVRRWTVRDITVARMLADHVAQALARLEPQLRPSVPSASPA
jgi:EAL domain-containing protein (putative c-di-GMP-specific phosphodiesterase class I)